MFRFAWQQIPWMCSFCSIYYVTVCYVIGEYIWKIPAIFMVNWIVTLFFFFSFVGLKNLLEFFYKLCSCSRVFVKMNLFFFFCLCCQWKSEFRNQCKKKLRYENKLMEVGINNLIICDNCFCFDLYCYIISNSMGCFLKCGECFKADIACFYIF